MDVVCMCTVLWCALDSSVVMWPVLFCLFKQKTAYEMLRSLVGSEMGIRDRGKELVFDTWHRGEPLEKSAAPRPNVLALQIVNWFGGRGGHIGF